jgi:hypothetical protein
MTVSNAKRKNAIKNTRPNSDEKGKECLYVSYKLKRKNPFIKSKESIN